MGYKIKYEDMYSLLWDFKRDMDYLKDSVDNYKTALDSYLNTSAMSGQTADAVYNYFQEVHYVFLDSIKQIAQAFLDNFAGYKVGYYSIDLSTKFVLDEEGIEATKDKLADIYEIFTDESAKVNSAISDIDSIDGVEHYDAPGDQGIPTSHDNLNTKLTDLDTTISDFESTTVTSINNSIETLMALFIKSLESLFVPSQVEPNRYVSGSFGENPYAAAEIYMNEILQQNHDSNVEILDAIWEQETELHKMAEDRKVQGIWKAVGGGVLIVVGVVCIVGSAGAATPVVAGAWVAGGGTFLFGTADLIEGGQDIYHGSTGDLDTSSINWIRDSVFQGNQTAYDITEEVFSFAAGAMNPLGAASKTRTLTWRSGSVIVGKEALGEAAGFGGSYLAGQFTDNPTLQMLAGVGSSMIVGYTGNRLDARYNLSGLYGNGYYVHNPSENPKVMNDVVEDSTAVYGYRPSSDGSLKNFKDGFWSDPVMVEEYRQTRLQYIAEDRAIEQMVTEMQSRGCSPEEIARAACETRNELRIQSYFDADGNIINQKGYEEALNRRETRSYDVLRQTKTPEEIIESSMRTNPGMDACVGLYDANYSTYTD